jgi:DNA gyrase/topoisomerase IV subunit A
MPSNTAKPDDAADRLAILDAVIAAIDRRDEVIAAAYEAADRSELIATLQDLLALDRAQAVAIGDLQIFRFTGEDRRRLRREQASLRARIEARW